MSSNTGMLNLSRESSLEAGEPLYATASRVDTWLLLECGLPWGAKALPESNLPESVKNFLTTQLEAIPNSRFQLIRQNARSSRIRFYIAQSRPVDPVLYRFDLSTFEDILSLDISRIVRGTSGIASSDEHLFLVCTNGRRDICCAQYGKPLYEAMAAYGGESVWQTTHLGGHRFAGTMVCLPHGLYYGRVRDEDVKPVVESYRRERIHLENYRGCCGFDSPVQAAEYFIRRQSGILEIGGIHLTDFQRQSDHFWKVDFSSARDIYTLQVESYLSEFEVYESSGNVETARVTQYKVTIL